MKPKLNLFILLLLVISFSYNQQARACSSFKLQKGKKLVYGHNLNEGDIGVPGLLFVNKRGIFKTGRTWSEIFTKEQSNPSSFAWISRYGSVTFNTFGRDLPDGGMNEEGLFIWEMNDDTQYPKNKDLPKLNQMNWMQYILDNCRTTDEAIKTASEFEIDGWGWHYFVGDAQGNTAAIEFIKGKVVVHKGKEMPVPGLFNEPYAREMDILRYYKGFGGDYEPDLNDSKVPRFVKTAVMTRDYNPDENIVDYGLKMLDQLMVDDVPEWSVLFDVRSRTVYFKTRINPEIKKLSMAQVDFSNNSPTLIANIDMKEGGNMYAELQPFTNERMKNFTEKFIFSLIPELPAKFFTGGGLTLEEYAQRTSSHSDYAKTAEAQFFKGEWKNMPDKLKKEMDIILKFESNGEAITGSVSNGRDIYAMDNLSLAGNKVKFTFKTKGGTLIEIKSVFDGGQMKATMAGIENNYGTYVLNRILP